MSGRYARLDSDEERLPEGVERIGYDADTQIYTYRDSSGAVLEGEEGQRYGHLRPTGRTMSRAPTPTFYTSRNKREDWRYMAPFFLLVIVFLVVVFKFFGPVWIMSCPEGTQKMTVQKGDSCWAIADNVGTTIDELKRVNPGLNCDLLAVGKRICVPTGA